MEQVHKENVGFLMECVNGAVNLERSEKKAVYAALEAGWAKIVQADSQRQQADAILHPPKCPDCGAVMCLGTICDCHWIHFDVESIDQGYGFWSRGGYTAQSEKGKFWIAADPDGEALPEVARMQEPNGRHALNIIYPDCYILQAMCSYTMMVAVGVYRIISINRHTLKASCERVSTEEWQQAGILERAVEVAREGCSTKYNRCNHYYWRARNE